MAIACAAIAEKFSQLVGYVSGPLENQVTGLASPRTAKDTDLIFVSDQKHLKEALSSRSRSWVVHKSMVSDANVAQAGRLVLSSSNVQLAMARIGRELFPQNLNKQPFGGERLHPSAVISPSAQLGARVLVGPNATIGDRVQIGDDCIIGANTTIEAEVKIGPRTHVHPQVYIAYDCEIGADCEIHPQTSIGTEGFGYAHDEKGNHYRLTHYGKVILEDRVHIGAGVQIDRGTFEPSRIGAGAIIDNHCHFGHNIQIGRGTVIAGGMIAAGSVTIGNHCVFGGRTTISGHLKIADGSQFAGLSGIPSSIDAPGQYGGYPPLPLKTALKVQSSLGQLPRLRRNLAHVMKKLGLTAEGEE